MAAALTVSVGYLVGREAMWYNAREEEEHQGLARYWEGNGSSMDLTDEQLVSRARAGEEWAFEELVNRHQSKAYTLALQMCFGETQEAQDLTQEAFLRAFRNLRKFRGDSSFYTWFFRIVVNTCLDGRRRRRRWERIFSFRRARENDEDAPDEMEGVSDPSSDTNPMEVLRGKQLSGEVRKALADLPERQRLALQLKVLHGMSLKEIAQMMGAAEGTVKSHLFRATHHLQRALKEWV